MATPSGSSPTALRWWFAMMMKRLREEAGVSRETAARTVKGSLSGMGHIESGRSLPKPLELDALLALYGAADKSDLFNDLRLRARRGKDWWIGLDQDQIPQGFDLFLGLESSASQIESWDALVVPGLFQTPEYAEALIRGGAPELPEVEIARRVELRLSRQREVLQEGQTPTIWRVLAEPAVRWMVGGPTVMRNQLRHLIALAQRPEIKVQILPLAVGAHPGIDGTFTLLSAPSELEGYPGCVYVETRLKPYYYEEQEHLRQYRNALAELRLKAVAPEDSPVLLDRMVKELKSR